MSYYGGVPPWIHRLPAVNASLNALSAACLAAGYGAIRRGRRRLHLRLMAAALVSSTLFLASYLLYHAYVGSVRYAGPARGVYLAILLTHTLLAAVVPFLAARLVWLSWRQWPAGDFGRHAALARRTLPLWLYVCASGVAIYGMLYVWPGGAR